METLYLAMRASADQPRHQAFAAMEEVLGGIPAL